MAWNIPVELGGCVAKVGKVQGLGDKHVHRVVTEAELHIFLAQLKAYGLCLGCDEEIEGSIVDIVRDRCAELFYNLTAEDNVKSGFLSCGNHLANWRAHTKFRVGVHHESYVDILPEVICDDEGFRRLALHENVLEIDPLGSSSYLL